MKKKNKLGTQYKTILAVPAITDNTNFQCVLGRPHIIYERVVAAGIVVLRRRREEC